MKKSALIIFGAGASYDCVPKDLPEGIPSDRPPLTNELVSSNKLLDRYPSASSEIARIRHEVGKGRYLEEVLSEYRTRSKTIKHTKTFLDDFTKYLAHRFKECSQNYMKTASNYEILIRGLVESEIEPVLVTFNYDTLLEEAIRRVTRQVGAYRNMTEYTQCEFPVVKIHGSWNWVRGESGIEVNDEVVNDKSVTSSVVLGLPYDSDKTVVCPVEHIQFVRDRLCSIDVIIVIGWRGNEPHFMDQVFRGYSDDKEVGLVAVSRSPKSCDSLEEKFKERIKRIRRIPSTGKFSEFVLSGVISKMFER